MSKRDDRIASLSFSIAYIDGMTKSSDMQDDEDVKKVIKVLEQMLAEIMAKRPKV